MNPVLIGAGIGALGSSVQGKSPLTGALLGGATGGLFGGSESLFGDKIANAFSGLTSGNVAQGVQAATGQAATQAIPSVGIQNIGQFAQPLAGVTDDLGVSLLDDVGIAASRIPSTNIPLSTADLAGGITDKIPLNSINTSKLFNYTNPTMMDKIQGLGSDAFSFAKNNPVASGTFALRGLEEINRPTQIDTSAQRPIRQGQFDAYTPTAAANNVAPQILPVPVNKTGMPQLNTILAQNPELRKFYPDLFGG